MSDLEERLRACGDCGSGCIGPMQEAADALAAVREWAEKTEYLGYADDYSHGLVKAQLEILAILNGHKLEEE